ncbi:MAG: hydroxylamine reductase [Candidatus Fermentibacteraceae bacterium]|nr:hydroxylamine reductase [Candidatus Fermentibacteraceae bacterium]MBN2608073.1 hydroxylamine reductase [Candidatus Fermentibacteraceae bacterium]
MKGVAMFCFQCEQTAKGTGCDRFGVCGKDPETAAMQDLLVYVSKGIAMWAVRAGRLGTRDHEADVFIIEALFTTVTNVNFDAETLVSMISRGVGIRDRVRGAYREACREKALEPEDPGGPAVWEMPGDEEQLKSQAARISILERMDDRGRTLTGLEELVTYGLKGSAAYAEHARILGVEDDDIYMFFHEALDFLTGPRTAEELFAMALQVGEKNIRVMEMLDSANTGTYGHPEPTVVRVTPVKGKAVAVSGHDLKDLEELLKQTEGKGINVYTHGEMLPTLAYPGLKKYSHLVGNYGGAWQDQQKEFDEFPGAILMTTNCIQKPRDSYMDRIFTTGLVQYPGVAHIEDRDFKPVIDAALAAEGFSEDAPEKNITIGFGRNAVMSVADTVIDAVNSGSIRHFFLVGGCDGAKPGRNYFTELAQKVPEDCVILTLACGKFRFNKLEFGDIGGIPRLLDIGQCNDAYSAISIASALAGAFHCGVNDLPLSMVLSWYEQKAVTILLSLFYLGIRDIRLGPTLPAFLTPDALQVLVEKFDIKPITTPDEDLKAILA